jgi:2-iminobutanoate/2-iminopropanoate deaminase
MAKREIKHPDRPADAPPGPYSAALAMDGWLFVSGQGPVDIRTMQVVRGTIEEETRSTLDNIDKLLRAAGCPRENVVKSTVHLADIKDFDRFNKVYMEFFTGVRPARTTVQSALWNGIKVEIDVIAKMP